MQVNNVPKLLSIKTFIFIQISRHKVIRQSNTVIRQSNKEIRQKQNIKKIMKIDLVETAHLLRIRKLSPLILIPRESRHPWGQFENSTPHVGSENVDAVPALRPVRAAASGEEVVLAVVFFVDELFKVLPTHLRSSLENVSKKTVRNSILLCKT